MWHWLSIPIFAFSLLAHSDAVSTGPTSAEEGRVLWEDSQTEFQAGHWEDAIPKLERFVARYPGYPGTNQAPLLLARAYLQTRQPAKAKPLLKDFALVHQKSLEGIQARTLLIRTRLALQEFPESLLATKEIEKLPNKTLPSDSSIRAEVLILKSKALIGLKRDIQALKALNDGEKLIAPTAEPALRGEAKSTKLELKLRECAKFPSPGPLDEAAVRHQLDRRGTCLLESMALMRETLLVGYLPSTQVSSGLMSHAFAAYLESCQHPPAPPKLRPKDRTPQQLETYFKELTGVLEQDCRKKIKQGAELLGGLEKETSAELEKLSK